MLVILACLPFLLHVNAVLSILYPNSNTIWYKNSTVNLNWTSSDPAVDTFLFQAVLSNQDSSVLSGNQRIADSTNATADYVRISLPGVAASSGYIVSFVNTTNQSQVLAKSDPFEIQDGSVHSSSAGPSATFASTPVNTYIPNAKDTGTFPSSFPSASGSAGRLVSVPVISLVGTIQSLVLGLGVICGLVLVL